MSNGDTPKLDIFVPFIQEPTMAYKALKEGIVQTRGICVPSFKHKVQKNKSAITTVKRYVTSKTLTSDYQKATKDHLDAIPIGYIHHILPVGRGPTGFCFPKETEYGGEFCSLFESIVFRVRYADDGNLAKLAHLGKVGHKIAEALADAQYYWSTIGKPITTQWLKFGFQLGTSSVKVGVFKKSPEPGFKLEPKLADLKDATLKLRKFLNGEWVEKEIVKNYKEAFKTFEHLVEKKGTFHKHYKGTKVDSKFLKAWKEQAIQSDLYKLVFMPNEYYLTEYNMNKKPELAKYMRYPYDKKLPPIISENSLGLVHNFMHYSHYLNINSKSIQRFNEKFPYVVAATQFTPLLVLNRELVLAHDKRIIRVREVGEQAFHTMLKKLERGYNIKRREEDAELYFDSTGKNRHLVLPPDHFIRQYCYPDWAKIKADHPTKGWMSFEARDHEHKIVGSRGAPAFFVRDGTKLVDPPGGIDFLKFEKIRTMQRLGKKQREIDKIRYSVGSDAKIKYWGMTLEDNDMLAVLKKIYQTHSLKKKFKPSRHSPWILNF
jgi:hypothetical protein